MHDPWTNYRTTGTWEDHASYSLGGIDKPLGYGTALIAPATGVLHTSGRPAPGVEFQCGEVGSAGRRSILMLDRPIDRVGPTSDALMLGFYRESDEPMVALVFQHQSKFGEHGRRYREGDKSHPVGWSGASANGSNWGGDAHLHWHGLTADGRRVNPLAYIGSSPAGDGAQIITSTIESGEDDMKLLYITDSVDGNGIPGWALLNPRNGKVDVIRNTGKNSEQEAANRWAAIWGNARSCTRADLAVTQASIRETS